MSAVRGIITRITAMAVLCAGISLWFGVHPPLAAAGTRHRTLNQTRSFGAAQVTTDHAIDYFGLVADLDSPTRAPERHGKTPYGEARFLVDGQWTPWQRLDQDGAQHEGQFTGSLIAVNHASAYQVRNLPKGAHNWRAAAINTTEGPLETVPKPANEAHAAASCRSRADWGADESISKWSKGTDTQSFYPVQIITLHHTAGSNSSSQDYSATMRAIYSFHVKTNGWSDIAYQYLIDSKGIVYEGRNSGHTSKSCLTGGGDGSDFAHKTGTDLMVSGGHVYAQHGGNLGISLMGCYEDGACSGDTAVPAASVSALTTLLTTLSARHSLDPKGQVHYVNPTSGDTHDLPAIAAHLDWQATACPGANLYAKLPAIRTEVARRLAATANKAPTGRGQTLIATQDAPTTLTLAGSDPDGDPLTYSVTADPGHGTLSGSAPNLTYTPAAGFVGADRLAFTVDDGVATSAEATLDIVVRAPGSPLLYLGSSTSGTAGGVAFADDDVLIHDPASGAWVLYLDGSDVGLSAQDVDAAAVESDGSLLLSFADAFTLSGLGAVDDSDIVRFRPTSTGADTSGTWEWYLDGSDVGLSTSAEDVDAFALLPGGRLVISTTGSASVTGVSAADEDLMVLTPSKLGSSTAGTWAIYFDGSDVGLSTSSSEDVNGVWVDVSGALQLSTLGAFSVTGVSGDGSDIVTCLPTRLGSTTACTFSMFWDGSAHGFAGEVTDSFSVLPGA